MLLVTCTNLVALFQEERGKQICLSGVAPRKRIAASKDVGDVECARFE